jgi:adenylyl-sulfate kinase
MTAAEPDRNLTWHAPTVSRADRQAVTGQKPAVLWFTGLSGSGKSTLANAFEAKLHSQGRLTYLLDGDNVRTGLCADLGFGPEDRSENIRRVAHVARLLWDAGLIVLVSFISPFRTERRLARDLIGEDFLEIHVSASLDVCEKGDPKGLYKKARQGLIGDFTGISSPYERPEAAELTVETGSVALEQCVSQVQQLLMERHYSPSPKSLS